VRLPLGLKGLPWRIAGATRVRFDTLDGIHRLALTATPRAATVNLSFLPYKRPPTASNRAHH
jgi:hypothetical protein